jgi:hypothetical protein
MVSLCSVGDPISVANMVWTGTHRGFAVHFENNWSVVATQRTFRRRFNIPLNNAVPNGNTICSWVRQLEESGSTLRRRTHGRRRPIRTPENVQLVRASIQQSPRRSARRHAVALGMSDRSLRRILHFDLNFHPFKIMVFHEFSQPPKSVWANACTDYSRRSFLQ